MIIMNNKINFMCAYESFVLRYNFSIHPPGIFRSRGLEIETVKAENNITSVTRMRRVHVHICTFISD